jgi:hypothetical protein
MRAVLTADARESAAGKAAMAEERQLDDDRLAPRQPWR